MNIFYLPEIQSDEVHLSEEESMHAVKVLRLRELDSVVLVDGKGTLAEAEIKAAHPRKCLIRIMKIIKDFEKKNFSLHLAIAPTKNSERTEWLMEKATETGLDEFTPLLCMRSERRQVNIPRLEKVAISAMKQSLKAYLPEIHDMKPLDDFVRQPFNGRKFIAHCLPGEKPHLFDCFSPGEDVLIMIGPEGDFTSEEITLARQNGFQEISLGSSRLRTETAGLTACLAVTMKNEVTLKNIM